MKKLSPEQEKVLKVMEEHGGALERWFGGFWTYSGARVVSKTTGWDGKEHDVPEWSCGVRTLSAMHTKGYVVLDEANGTCSINNR